MPIYCDKRQFNQQVSDIPATEQEFDEQGGIALIRTLQFYKMAALAQAQHRQMIETSTPQGRRNRGPLVQ